MHIIDSIFVKLIVKFLWGKKKKTSGYENFRQFDMAGPSEDYNIEISGQRVDLETYRCKEQLKILSIKSTDKRERKRNS